MEPEDLDERLLAGLRGLAGDAAPPPDLHERVRGRMERYRRRVKLGGAVVAAGVLVAVASLVSIPLLHRDVPTIAGPPAEPAPTSAPPGAGVGRWEPLGRAPLDGTGAPLAVWTGDEMLVWSQAEASGAAYEPAAGLWRRLPDGPLSTRTGATAVWSGKELIVWGGRDGDTVVADTGAAYDPEAGKWRRLSRPPVAVRAGHSAVWTGTEMLVWGGAGSLPARRAHADGAAYDPAADRWRRLPQAPLRRRHGHGAVWTGTQMVVWGGEEAATRTWFGDGAAYDPAARRWSPLPPSPLTPRAAPAAVAAGPRLVVWGGEGQEGPVADGAAFDLSGGTWSALSVAPLAPRSLHAGVWTGAELLVWGGAGPGRRRYGDGAAYNPITGVWRRLPGAPLGPRYGAGAVWTGNAMVVWGGVAPGDPPVADGAAFRIGRPPAPAPARAAGPATTATTVPDALRVCREAPGVRPGPADVERYVEAFARLRVLGAGAEECLSPAALDAYRPERAGDVDPASAPAPLCLYGCGRTVVVEVRRDGDWLEGRPGGSYEATLTVVVEEVTNGRDRARFELTETLTLRPGRTWSGRSVRLAVAAAEAVAPVARS